MGKKWRASEGAIGMTVMNFSAARVLAGVLEPVPASGVSERPGEQWRRIERTGGVLRDQFARSVVRRQRRRVAHITSGSRAYPTPQRVSN